MPNHFEFLTGLRGFHIYSNTVNWKPCKGQKVTFKREHKNPYDKFAVAGKTLLKGKVGLIIVGHVPRELSRYIWYAIQEGAKFEVEVHKAKPKLSPLEQGGLEIPIKVLVAWDSCKKLSILVDKIKEVEYPITGNYDDESKNISVELGFKEEEDDGEIEFGDCYDDDIQVCE